MAQKQVSESKHSAAFEELNRMQGFSEDAKDWGRLSRNGKIKVLLDAGLLVARESSSKGAKGASSPGIDGKAYELVKYKKDSYLDLSPWAKEMLKKTPWMRNSFPETRKNRGIYGAVLDDILAGTADGFYYGDVPPLGTAFFMLGQRTLHALKGLKDGEEMPAYVQQNFTSFEGLARNPRDAKSAIMLFLGSESEIAKSRKAQLRERVDNIKKEIQAKDVEISELGSKAEQRKENLDKLALATLKRRISQIDERKNMRMDKKMREAYRHAVSLASDASAKHEDVVKATELLEDTFTRHFPIEVQLQILKRQTSQAEERVEGLESDRKDLDERIRLLREKLKKK